MRIYGNGFPAVGARHGCQLPDHPARRTPTTPAPATAADPRAADTDLTPGRRPDPAPNLGERRGYPRPAGCPVCGVPVDPAWTAATGSDRHGPCTTSPARMAAAARAHRATHRPDRPGAPDRPGGRRRPAPTPTRPATPSTTPTRPRRKTTR